MTSIVKTIQTGSRTVLNTDHPVTAALSVFRRPNRHPVWTATLDICNGVAGWSRDFPTRQQAVAVIVESLDASVSL
jgi:hypothetical protein